MKRFLIRVCVLLLLFIVVDTILGKAFSYMTTHAKDGDFKESNYICDGSNDDILIFGSSRAGRGISPDIISDSLGLTCHNCGHDGYGVILNYGRFHLLCQKRHPKLVIYDIFPVFDLLVNDNHKYLMYLKPYYDRKGIPEIFESIDDTEKYKMLSQLYRFNSLFITTIYNYIPLNSSLNIGFRPVDIEMDPHKTREVAQEEGILSYDSLKLEYLNKMVELSNSTRFVFVVSPIWYGMDSKTLQPVQDICKEKGLPLLDFSNYPKYKHNNEFFMDGVHLNAKGASEFSRDLAHELKERRILGE